MSISNNGFDGMVVVVVVVVVMMNMHRTFTRR
jgi:hypothetical protein